MHVLITCKYKKNRIKNTREKVETSFSPLKVNGRFLLPWKPVFWSNLSWNLMQPFPHRNDASYKIWSTLAYWPQRYSSFIWIMTEWQNHRILEGQGKSSIAPTFSKRGYNYKLVHSKFPWHFQFSCSLKALCSHVSLFPWNFFTNVSLLSTITHLHLQEYIHVCENAVYFCVSQTCQHKDMCKN